MSQRRGVACLDNPVGGNRAVAKRGTFSHWVLPTNFPQVNPNQRATRIAGAVSQSAADTPGLQTLVTGRKPSRTAPERYGDTQLPPSKQDVAHLHAAFIMVFHPCPCYCTSDRRTAGRRHFAKNFFVAVSCECALWFCGHLYLCIVHEFIY